MNFIDNLKENNLFIIGILIFNFIIFILYIANIIKLNKINKNYENFLKKLGKNTTIEEDLKKYIEDVENTQKTNEEIINYCKNIDNNINKCIKKIGIVRYNAFENVGSNLSFTLALLNEKNDGVVLNGIYAQDMSNIYAKPIKNGESEYTLSEEEIEAINKAKMN